MVSHLNGDGINDTWHITGIERYPGNHVDIYNRWEVKVYEADNYQILRLSGMERAM